MDEDRIVEYITSDPELLGAFNNKSLDEQNSIIKELSSGFKKEKPINSYQPIELEDDKRAFFQAGIAGLGPNPVKSIEEIGIAGAQGLNAYGYGIPRYIARKFGTDIPEQNTMTGKGLSLGAQGVGIAVSPATKLVSSIGSKLIPEITGVGTGLLKGAFEGGVIGGLQTPEDEFFNLNQRGLSGIAGATIGGLTGSLFGAYNAYKSWKSGALAKPKLEVVNEAKAGVSSKYSNKTKLNNKAVTNLQNRIKNNLTKFKEGLKNNIQQQADVEARNIQKTMREAMKDISGEYSSRADTAIDRVIKNKGSKVNTGDISDVLNNSAKEIKDMGVDSGKAYNQLVKLAQKYKIDKITIGDDGIPIFEDVAAKPVDLGKAIKDIRSATSQLSAGFKSSSGRANPDDLAAQVLRYNWNNYLGQFDDGLSTLNTEYSTTMREMKPMMRLVKPYGVDTEVKTLANTINNAATGKSTPNDLRLLSKIEDGVAMYKGVGKQTEQSSAMGNQLAQNIEIAERRIAHLEKIGKLKQIKLNNTSKEALRKLGVEEEAIKQLARNKKVAFTINNVAGSAGLIAAYALKRYFTGKVLKGLNVVTGTESSGGQ